MKILYVTEMWQPLYDILYKSEKKICGMPAFFNVLEIISQKHSVDMLIFDHTTNAVEDKPDPKIEWMKGIKYYVVKQKFVNSGFRKPINHIINFFKTAREANKLLKAEKYDFVYGHTPYSEGANAAAKKQKIPFGLRRYGDTYYSLIKSRGLFYAMLSQPINYLSYKKRKSFVISTNDGSRVDLAYKRINKSKTPYPLYDWLNGTNKKNIEASNLNALFSDKPYLLYVARIVQWKRQHLAVELIKKLSDAGLNITLVLAGNADDRHYFDYINKRAEEAGVTDSVKYVGEIDKSMEKALTQKAVAALSFYDPCNLGNVLIEYLTFGGVVISMNDGSLDGIIKNRENGFLVNNMDEAAEVIKELYQNKFLSEKISENAKKSADELFLSWDERCEKEIQLIEETVIKYKNKNKK